MKKRKGKQIKTLNEFGKVIMNEPSIYVSVWGRAHPTAFFQGWRIRTVIQWLEAGRFFRIKKKRKPRKKVIEERYDPPMPLPIPERPAVKKAKAIIDSIMNEPSNEPEDLKCISCGRELDVMEHNYGTPEHPVCIQCYGIGS